MNVPDLVEPIVGYRSWRVRHIDSAGRVIHDPYWPLKGDAPRLIGFMKTIWPIDRPLRATCERGVYEFDSCPGTPCPPLPANNHSYRSPHASTFCGIHAYKRPPWDEFHPGFGYVWGKVLLWGKTYEHEFGWRAEYGQMLALKSFSSPDDDVRLIAGIYNVPIIDEWDSD